VPAAEGIYVGLGLPGIRRRATEEKQEGGEVDAWGRKHGDLLAGGSGVRDTAANHLTVATVERGSIANDAC
jgi:hypothetical protein